MKINRTKNASRNMVWGILNKVICLLIPFISRGAIIRIFGINYLGLNSLFSSLLYMLNFVELGFSSSVVFFMYQAIADDNQNQLCALLNFYKKTYRIIGSIILVVGLSITPFLGRIITKDLPDEVNVFLLYLISLAGTVSTYFFYAYKGSLIIAFHRNDVSSKVSTVILLAERIIQLLCILLLKNYYLFLFCTIISNIINNIAISYFADRLFPGIRAKGNLSDASLADIKKKVRGLFYYKIGGVVLSAADSLVISSILGLAIGGIYANYYYVITTLFSFFSIYYSSIKAGLGNSLAVESKSKNLDDLKLLQFIQNWLVGWSTICLLCLFQDFINVYAGSSNTLEFGVVLCLCFYYYSWKIQDIVSVYKDACGLWDKDKYRPLLGSVINLTLNLLTVKIIGLYGVVLSTVIVLVFIDLPWASKVLFKEYFHTNNRFYLIQLLTGTLENIAIAIPTYLICCFINTGDFVLNILIKLFVCIIVPNLFFIILNYRKREFCLVKAKIKVLLPTKSQNKA